MTRFDAEHLKRVRELAIEIDGRLARAREENIEWLIPEYEQDADALTALLSHAQSETDRADAFRAELERLRDVVSDEDAALIDAALSSEGDAG